MPGYSDAFLRKSLESLAGARVAVAAGRHNAAARSAYYAAFQAAVAALWDAGIRPAPGVEGTLSHRMVQSEWAGRLIYRRKLYPPELQPTLRELMELRLRADYTSDDVSARRAIAAVSAAETLVQHVEQRLGRQNS